MKENNFFKKALVGMAALTTVGAASAKTAESELINSNSIETQATQDTIAWEKCSVVEMKDQGMSDGIVRKQFGITKIGHDGKPYFKPYASIFTLDQTKTKAQFVTSQQNPNLYAGDINYGAINKHVEKNGAELAIGFAGAYKSADGIIEGVAYENGVSVGHPTRAAYGGIVYFNPQGQMELMNCKDKNGTFDENVLSQIQQRAVAEKGSFFQQKMIIQNSEAKTSSTNQTLFEWRALCKGKDGSLFVLNCSEKITLAEFMKMALSMKDEKGQKLVSDVVLEDTGDYSTAVFRDKAQIDQDKMTGGFDSHVMVDENYPNKKNYTNTVVIGVKH